MGKEAHFMAIRYKVDIMAELKKKGYSSTKIREVDRAILPPTDTARRISVVEDD